MVTRHGSPARMPPTELPEYDPATSRLVSVDGVGADEGLRCTWHVLDNSGALNELSVNPIGTILAVHGNPTWSYLWRRLVQMATRNAAAGKPAWRIVAVDQLEMGFSERTGQQRRLDQRILDLSALTDTLGLSGPVVTLGHDWGGLISLGWALQHREQLAGVALLNTAVSQPEGTPIPAPLRLARARGVRTPATAFTPAFLDTTLALARPGLEGGVRAAFRSPYVAASARDGIDAFVDDIPVDSAHPSHDTLQRVAEGIRSLDVPALLLWGPEDPIFSDRYLNDLLDRLPHAAVHRFEGDGHLVAEDAPYAPAVLDWLDTLSLAPANVTTPIDAEYLPLWDALNRRQNDDDPAVIDLAGGRDGTKLVVSWRALHDRVDRLANGLSRIGVKPGDRVSLLIPPGASLTAVVYACLRIGAVVVVADAGLGVAGLGRAIRGAWPQFIISDTPGLVASRVRKWPGIRISLRTLPRSTRAALGVRHTLGELLHSEGNTARLPEPSADDDAAVLFTSGSTGPAKGVVYTHRQLSAVRDVLAAAYEVGDDPGLVTGFAPFALLGPALGTRSATPRMNHSSPRTLTARAVAEATRASGARLAFLSPAAILGVTSTADQLSERDRDDLRSIDRFLSTGAPIGAPLLTAVSEIMPAATAHTPYGMTECLLVTDITKEEIVQVSAQSDNGVCVGTPFRGNRVLISALDEAGVAVGPPSSEPGILGEIVISAPHLKRRYDRLWVTDRAATRDTDPTIRSHRTGDVGHLDDQGRLWVEGRLPHVITTPAGLRAPVGIEQAAEQIPGVLRAAAVGVGPIGTQQIVIVLETTPAVSRRRLASAEMTAAVREGISEPIAAVLLVPELPTDIRHNSKIDRTLLSSWATRALSGEPIRKSARSWR